MFLRPGFMVVIVGATLTTLSTIVVALRLYCRRVLMGSLGAADHLMFVALVFSWGMFVINYYQDETSQHYRPSQLRNPAKRPQIEGAVRGTLIAWWAYRLGYVIALCFVKLSILFFYRAIAAQRTFRRLVNATIVFVCLYTFAAVIASIFQCERPSDSWATAGYFAQFDRKPTPMTMKVPMKDRHKVKCYDPVRLWVFSAAINLLSDVIIILLPIPALLSLRVPMQKRLALVAIFSIGIIAIVASSVRMWVMMLWAESPQNSAKYGADLLLWGQVETNSGIISASVPFLRHLSAGRDTTSEQRKDAPKPMGLEVKDPVKVEEAEVWDELEKEKDVEKEGDVEKGARKRGWQPFITVPVGLSRGGPGDTVMETVHKPYGTV